MTVFPPTKGQWVSPDGKLFREDMIAVRILCTESDIDKIINFTATHYDQIAVMAYVVSAEIKLKHFPENT